MIKIGWPTKFIAVWNSELILRVIYSDLLKIEESGFNK